MATRTTREEFIAKSKKKHGDHFDYSLVNYVNSLTKVTLICKVHGKFEQTPGHHLNRDKCPACYRSKCHGKIDLTQELALRFLSYCQDTGELTWKESLGHRHIGDSVSHVTANGYKAVRIGKKLYLAHRVAWLMVFGKFPNGQIDHINGNRLDNRLENLRDVADGENKKNIAMSTRNTSGVMGVSYDNTRNMWAAYINEKRTRIIIKYFKCKDEAIAKRKEWEIEFNFHPNHGRSKTV